MTTCADVCRSENGRENLRTMTLDEIAHVDGVGRDALETRIAFLVFEQRTLEATLRASQAVATRLHEELVEVKKAWPHWICHALNADGKECRAFNGEVKEPLPRCRGCGSSREVRTG